MVKYRNSNQKSLKARENARNAAKKYYGYPALSREDNKTEICSECGIREALATFSKTVVEKT